MSASALLSGSVEAVVATLVTRLALGLLLPPFDHLPAACGDRPGVVLYQYLAQNLHRGDLTEPGRGSRRVHRSQERVAVPGVVECELVLLGLGGRQRPGVDPLRIPAAPRRHVDDLGHPVRCRGRQRFQGGAHGLPGQLQAIQIPYRGDNVRGVGALLAPARQQALLDQCGQQQVQCPFLQPVLDHPGTKLRQHRVVKARIGQLQP